MQTLRAQLTKITETFTQILSADRYMELFISSWVQEQIAELHSVIMASLYTNPEVYDAAELAVPNLTPTEDNQSPIDWEPIEEIVRGGAVPATGGCAAPLPA